MVKISIRKINLYFHLDTSLFFVVGVGCKCLLCYETPDTIYFRRGSNINTYLVSRYLRTLLSSEVSTDVDGSKKKYFI